jgi:hypothetical protein
MGILLDNAISSNVILLYYSMKGTFLLSISICILQVLSEINPPPPKPQYPSHFYKVSSHYCPSFGFITVRSAYVEDWPLSVDSAFYVYIEAQSSQNILYSYREILTCNELKCIDHLVGKPEAQDITQSVDEWVPGVVKLHVGKVFRERFKVGPFVTGWENPNKNNTLTDPNSVLVMRDDDLRPVLCLQVHFEF